MKISALSAGIRRLRGVMAVQGRPDDSDEQLLHAFTTQHDDSAFAALVCRYGPLVLGVCRRVLRHAQDAEDAFQATFLLLSRNAATLRNKTALASWLHGAAYRVAMTAKRSAVRRRKYESQAPTRPSTDPAEELSWSEVRALLDEEIARLPEIYRSVFVLCCLENMSREEAARRLNLKEGTVSSRLTGARKRLAQRLTRRGVELTALLAACTLATQSGSALSPLLLSTTIKSAFNEGAAGLVSAQVAGLAKSAASAMMLSKMKMAAVLLAVGLLSSAGVWLSARPQAVLAPSPEPPAAQAENKPPATGALDPAQRKTTKSIEIQGRVLDPDGKPKPGAKLLLLGPKDKVKQLGTTAADGLFRVVVPQEATKYRMHCCLVAAADGAALDFLRLDTCKEEKPVELRLTKDHPIQGRVVNTEGKPIRGVRVAVESIDVPTEWPLDTFLIAWKKRSFGSSIGCEKRFRANENSPLETTTDADGRFILHGAGVERFVSLRLSGSGIADEEVSIVNRAGFDPEPYNQAARDSIPKGEKPYSGWFLNGPNVSVVTEAEKPIHGVVTDADTGKPLPGVRVRGVNQTAKTDAEGRYQIHGVRKAKSYTIGASDPSTGYMASQVRAADTAGYQPIRADLRVKKGVIITGKVIDQATGKSVPGYAAAAVLAGNPFVKDYPEMSSHSLLGDREYTDGDGAFRIVTIPGPVLLMANFDYTQSTGDFAESMKYDDPLPDPKYPQYIEKSWDWVNYHPFGGGRGPVQGKFCKVLEIKPGTEIVHQDAVLRRASVRTVKIEDAEGRPVRGAWVAGIGTLSSSPVRVDDSSCLAYGVKADKPRPMVFFHTERKIAGTLTLTANEKQPATVKLKPMGSAKGRLVDLDGKPLAGVVVNLWYVEPRAYWVHEHIYSNQQFVTDAAGAFTLDKLVPGLKFQLSFQRRKQRFEHETKPAGPEFQVDPGVCRDLGPIKVREVRE